MDNQKIEISFGMNEDNLRGFKIKKLVHFKSKGYVENFQNIIIDNFINLQSEAFESEIFEDETSKENFHKFVQFE